jgi:hypothetical protein
MLGIKDQVGLWQLALIIAAPFVVIWAFRELNPLVALFLMLVILDVGALVGGADSRARGDWTRR